MSDGIEGVTRFLDVRIEIRNDTSANWESENPILLKGEMGVENNTNLFKFGDGISTWNELKYGASPSIKLIANPGPSDWKYQTGTLAIVNDDKIWVLTSNGENAAIWKRLMTTEDVLELGVGDMLKDIFATSPKASSGYVDKAIVADTLTQGRTITIDGDVISAGVEFDGSENIILNAALADIVDLAGGGTFIKVQVDGTGRVIGYEALLASDIPDITLSKITDAGTAAGRNIGTAIGQVVVVEEDGKIDPSLIPSIAITDVMVVDDEMDMITLNAEQGDVAICRDTSKTFILGPGEPDELSSWIEITSALDGIQSINGKTGTHITIDTDDVEEGDTNRYFTDERVIGVMETQSSDILTDGESLLHDTDVLILNGGSASDS